MSDGCLRQGRQRVLHPLVGKDRFALPKAADLICAPHISSAVQKVVRGRVRGASSDDDVLTFEILSPCVDGRRRQLCLARTRRASDQYQPVNASKDHRLTLTVVESSSVASSLEDFTGGFLHVCARSHPALLRACVRCAMSG